MSFSKEWESIYSRGEQWTSWPWSDLVSYVKRYAKTINDRSNVLELGCGVGANVPFVLSLNANYYGIDGSEIAIEFLKTKFSKVIPAPVFIATDFTQNIPFNEEFDLAYDRAAITHNDTSKIMVTLKSVHEKLKSNGIFIGIDWFSRSHSDSSKGEKVDSYTRRNIQDGQFSGVGNVHFSDKNHLIQLFCEAGFDLVCLEHKVNKCELPANDQQIATWNICARKLAGC